MTQISRSRHFFEAEHQKNGAS